VMLGHSLSPPTSSPPEVRSKRRSTGHHEGRPYEPRVRLMIWVPLAIAVTAVAAQVCTVVSWRLKITFLRSVFERTGRSGGSPSRG
jgi:hypothetical protein